MGYFIQVSAICRWGLEWRKDRKDNYQGGPTVIYETLTPIWGSLAINPELMTSTALPSSLKISLPNPTPFSFTVDFEASIPREQKRMLTEEISRNTSCGCNLGIKEPEIRPRP